MAALGCQLRDSTLFVKKLPVDSSTVGVMITTKVVLKCYYTWGTRLSPYLIVGG